MPASAHIIRSLLLCMVAACAVGCRGHAEQHVVSAAWSEAESLRTDASVVHAPTVERYVDDLGTMILEAARELEGVDAYGPSKKAFDAHDQYDIVIVHSLGVNAWVYGDDFACVSTNLLLQTENPEELVAVLCHEFAHIHEGHLIEAKEREYAHYAWGDALQIMGTAAELGLTMYGGLPVRGIGDYLKQAHLSQGFEPRRPGDEFEADAYGLELYAAMGLDLQKFDDFLERALELYGDRQGKSHPGAGRRLERVRQLSDKLKRVTPGPTHCLDPERFRTMQATLRGELVEMGEAGKLIAFEDTVRENGQQRSRATACTPLLDDNEHLRVAFARALFDEDVEARSKVDAWAKASGQQTSPKPPAAAPMQVARAAPPKPTSVHSYDPGRSATRSIDRGSPRTYVLGRPRTEPPLVMVPHSRVGRVDRARSRVNVMGGTDAVVRRCEVMMDAADESGMGDLTYRVAADLLTDVLWIDPAHDDARRLQVRVMERKAAR